MDKKPCSSEENEVRKGPWTMEEDLILVNYITNHGEGVWNTLARSSGLRRTGKSCRLRWLNYLRPGVRRGNITPEEQLLIMELHARWGNRWSKIARQLPGRTDNEIKNFWRTKIQKKIKPAENSDYQNSMSTQGYAGSSQMSGVEYGVDSCLSMYDATAPNADTFLGPPSAGSNENFWTEEDLWSMHIFDDNEEMD